MNYDPISKFVEEFSMMTLSSFRSGLRDDLCRELFVRGVGDLEHAYQIVRDLDTSRGSSYQKSSDYKTQSARANSGQSQFKIGPSNFTPTEDLKDKGPAESVPRTYPTPQGFKCQGCGQVEKFYSSKSRALFSG